MRRLFLLVPAMLTLMLATSPVASASEAPIREPAFKFQADGFQVSVRGAAEGEEVELALFRHGQTAIYKAPATITEDSVQAKFGQFGELDYTFTPGAGKKPRCKGADGTTEGTFSGAFDFTGENDFVSFELGQAQGTFELFPEEGCEEPPKSSQPSARATSGARGTKSGGDKGEEFSLTVAAGNGRRGDYLLAFTLPTKGGTRIFFDAFQAEQLPGVAVARGVEVAAGRGALRWDRKSGVAQVSPPAPFTGSAVFEKGTHGKATWKAPLSMPVLGGKPIKLTGSRFHAQLGEGSLLESE